MGHALGGVYSGLDRILQLRFQQSPRSARLGLSGGGLLAQPRCKRRRLLFGTQ
jgi:hypothetical protein